jgi:hypothetical protein
MTATMNKDDSNNERYDNDDDAAALHLRQQVNVVRLEPHAVDVGTEDAELLVATPQPARKTKNWHVSRLAS